MERLSAEEFQDFISQGKKVVEFSADWCVDCKRIAPDMPDIIQQYGDHFEFAELDVDESRSIAEQYNVKGIPTFIVFQDGVELGRLPSREAKTKDQVEAFLEQWMNDPAK